MSDDFLQETIIEDANYPSLKGRSILITGGASGIGAGLVKAFCKQQANVMFFDIDEVAAKKCSAEVEAYCGIKPLFSIVNLANISEIELNVREFEALHGPISCLVNNAGVDHRCEALNVTQEYWDERFAINIRHQFFTAQSVLPLMIKNGGGSIINMGSTSWMFGAAGFIAYTTSKSATEGLTKSLAREFGMHKIRVNSIAPGLVFTEKKYAETISKFPERIPTFLQKQCLKEFLLPSDIARLALWLAADDSRLVTSQTFIIDAGVL